MTQVRVFAARYVLAPCFQLLVQAVAIFWAVDGQQRQCSSVRSGG